MSFPVISNPTEFERLSLVVNWFRESRDWRWPLDFKIDRLYQQVRNYLQLDESWAWQSRVAIPEAFTIIWTMLPTVLESMLSQPPYIKVRPLRPDTVQGSKFAELLLDNQLKRIGHDKEGIYMTMLKVWQDCFMYGNGFYDLFWRFDVGIQRRRVPIFNEEPIVIDLTEQAPGVFGFEGQPLTIPANTVFLGYEIAEEKKAVYDDPDVNIIDWKSVYPDPWSKGIQAPSRYIITRETWTEEQGASFENDPGYKNINKLEFTDTGVNTDPELYDFRRDVDEVNWGVVNAGKKGQFAEILKCQYKRKVGGEWREWWTIIGNRFVEIFDGPNPYHHDMRTLVKADCFPLTDRVHSVGLIEPVEDLNDGINQGYNRSQDIVQMKLSPMFQASPNFYDNIDEEFQGNLPSIPGLILRKPNNQESIEPIQFGGDFMPAVQDIQYLTEKRKLATGTSEIVSGALPTQRRETATTVMSAEARASLRHRTLMKTLWFTSVRPLADRIIAMNHQFKEAPEFVKLPGAEQFMKIFMEDIPWDGFALEPNMTFISGITKEMKARQIQEMMVQLAPTPLGERFKWDELFLLLAEFNDLPEAQNLVMSEEEFMQKQAQLLAMAQQQGQGQAQGQGQQQIGQF